MAVAIASTPPLSDSQDSNSTVFSFALGITPTDGRLLVAAISRYGLGDDVQSNSGWTKIFSADAGSANHSVWTKLASSETATHVWSSAVSGKWAGGVVEISGQAAAGVIDAQASSTGTGTSVTAPSITTTVNDALILTGAGTYTTSDLEIDSGAGLTEQFDKQTTATTAVNLTAGSKLQTIATNIGTFAHTLTNSREWFAWTIAITPDISGGGTEKVNFSISDNTTLVDENGVNLDGIDVDATVFDTQDLETLVFKADFTDETVTNGELSLDVSATDLVSTDDVYVALTDSSTGERLGIYKLLVS